MQAFCKFWVDERKQHPCCLTTPEEDWEEYAEEFNCETCPVLAQLEGLDDLNTRAWVLYRQISRRYLVDLGAGGVALQRLTADLDPETFAAVVDRLSVIYDYLDPPTARATE